MNPTRGHALHWPRARWWPFWIWMALGVGGLLFLLARLAPTEMGSSSYAVPTPSVSSEKVEGTIDALDMSSPGPTLTLKRADDGSLFSVALDRQETVVMQAKKVTEFNQLEKGQQVNVRYQQKDGREVATVVEITEPLPMPTPAD